MLFAVENWSEFKMVHYVGTTGIYNNNDIICNKLTKHMGIV